jgi:isoleucyl-tRNA synthetase
LHEVDGIVRADLETFDLGHMLTTLHNFCNTDLSAFYFDIRKDSLYCDKPNSLCRRSARTAMELVFDHLVLWLAPVLCFTAEEAFLARQDDTTDSVHLKTFPSVPAEWKDADLAAKWAEIRGLRRVVTGAMEVARNEKKIGSSLQAHPRIFLSANDGLGQKVAQLLKGLDFSEICICSDVTFENGNAPAQAFSLPEVDGVGVVVETATGKKCERCWQILPEVGAHADHPDLCDRCADAVK